MAFETNTGVKRFMRLVMDSTSATYPERITYPQDVYEHTSTQFYTQGTGNQQCNMGHHIYRSLLTFSNTDVNLYDLIYYPDKFNRRIRFQTIKWIYMKNHSATLSIDIFHGSVADVWSSMITPFSATSGITLGPKGEFFMSKPNSGGTVSSANRNIRIVNWSLSTRVMFEMAMAGLGTII